MPVMWQKTKYCSREDSSKDRDALLLQYKANQRDEKASNRYHTCRQSIQTINPIHRIHHASRPEPGQDDGRNGSERYSGLYIRCRRMDEQEEGRLQIPG